MMISSIDGFINQGERYSKDNAGTSKAKYTLLYYGELSYNHGNSKTKKYGSIFALKEQAALIPFVYHSFKIKNQNPFYFARYLNLPMHDRYLVKVISSGARMDGLLNISSEDFFKMPIQFPGLDEQNYIETFFDHVDCKISILNRKIKALKKYRKGIVNKWFSNNEITINFDNLVVNKPSPLLTSHIVDNDGVFPVYDASGNIFKTVDFYRTNNDSIAIIKYGSSCGRAFIAKGKHSVLGTMTELIPNHDEDLLYLYAFTISNSFKSICKKYTEVGTTPNLYFSDYSKADVYYPSEKKTFINAIDRLLKLENNLKAKLEKLSKIKLYLLSNLFI